MNYSNTQNFLNTSAHWVSEFICTLELCIGVQHTFPNFTAINLIIQSWGDKSQLWYYGDDSSGLGWEQILVLFSSAVVFMPREHWCATTVLCLWRHEKHENTCQVAAKLSWCELWLHMSLIWTWTFLTDDNWQFKSCKLSKP